MSSHWQSVRFTVLFLFGLLSMSAESATQRWTPTGPEGGSVWALTFDPDGSGRVFAQVAKVGAGTVADSLHKGILYAATENGIYKTTDGGEHWQRVSDKINTLRLAIDPANPQTLIVGTLMDGVLKTDDSGQHWYGLNNHLHEISVFDLITAPSERQVLYAST